MSQLQFKNTDTIQWQEGFGSRAEGDATPSGTADNPNTTFSGVEDATTGTVGSNTGFAIGDIVFIHQSRNGGDGAGKWQLNKIIDISGTTFTFKYKLTQDFDTTAQIVRVKQNKLVTISGTLTVPAWDGSKGGIIVLMGEELGGTGTIDASGANGTQSAGGRPSGGGYRAGKENESQHTSGYRGEGTSGDGNDQSTSANGNGAGAASNQDHGAGGGNGTAGTTTQGTGGSTAGSADLTTMVFGGGGSSGSGGDNSNAGSGGNGGAIVVLIFRKIDISAITINIQGGAGVEGNVGGGRKYGGNGAGGSCLMKGQTIILGTNRISASAQTGGNGGDGGVGRIHADYRDSISGSNTVAVDSTQDLTLNDVGGAFLALL